MVSRMDPCLAHGPELEGAWIALRDLPDPFERDLVAVAEVVDDDHLAALLQQLDTRVRTDVARATCKTPGVDTSSCNETDREGLVNYT